MKKKPFAINFLALCFLVAPVFNLFITAYFNHWPMYGPRGVIEHFSVYEWSIMAVYPFVALGIWLVTRWGYILFISFASLIIFHNFYVLMSNKLYSSYLVLLFQVTTLSVVGFFLQTNVSAPYFNPKLKWWESLPRFKSEIKGHGQIDERVFEVEFLDLSSGGCFIKTDEKLSTSDTVALEFWHKEDFFSGRGRIVWNSKKPVQGYGIKFKRLKLREKWALNRILNELKGKKIKKRLPMRAA